MNARIVATFVLAAASITAVQAQVELPNQWLDHQMKAARQEQAAKGRNAVIALDAAGAKAAAAPEVAHQAKAALAHQTPRPVANVAGNSPATQK